MVKPTPSRTYWSLALTPAQSWIAEARRSRDLLAGSRILAWLMGRLLGHLKAQGANVRLPQVTDEDLRSLAGSLAQALDAGSGGVSNHASGWVELPLADAGDLFQALEARLVSFWSDLCGEVNGNAAESAANLWRIAGPEIRVLTCPLQLTWALQEEAEGAGEGLAEIDAIFAAVKRSRPIAQHIGGGPVRKCGQCGKREAMGGEDPVKWRRFQADLSQLEEVKQGLRFDADEYLCPVCALRRFAGYLKKEPFPSTSEIAASEWLWRIRNASDLRAALRALRDAAKTVPGYKEDWADRAPLYYRRSLDRELRRSRREKDTSAEDKLGEVQTALRRLEKEIREHNRRDRENAVPDKPPEYLAVVIFDGDDMGRKLRKDLDTLPGKVVEFQKDLSAWFRGSGESLPPRGRPFYLGGDEGLILAPVAGVLDVARGIKATWDRTAGSTSAGATLSMGIALFDRERPLGAAIETARRSLERAKSMERPKKNALAVSVQTASGSEWTAVAHWGESWDRIRAAVDLIREGTLAAGWPHDVERFLRTVGDGALRGGDDSRAALREEVKRLTARRCAKEKARAAVWEALNGEAWWREQPAEEETATLPDHLHLAAFLARQAGVL